MHEPLDVAASIGHSEHRSAAIVRGRDTPEVAASFKMNQEVVHRLLGHVRPIRQFGWTDTVRSGALKHIHMGRREVWVTTSPNVSMEPLTNVEVEPSNEGGHQGRVH